MDKIEILGKLSKLSLRERQVYASECLRRYCEIKRISHCSIIELLNHLESITGSESLAKWDAHGAMLPLNGRGDPLPEDLESTLSEFNKQEFVTLVDSVVEVGIIDLYGAQSELPLKFLKKILDILEINNISFPKI